MNQERTTIIPSRGGADCHEHLW